MLTLKQNQNDDYDISFINSNESPIKDNNSQNYKDILKKNPTYKKTYDNTGYLWIGDVCDMAKHYYSCQEDGTKQNIKDKQWGRFKEKHILIPENEKFTISGNQESISNFLTNIKQNYKINNFHFFLHLHGNKNPDICAAFKYFDENGEAEDFDMTSGDVDTLLQSIKEVFKDDNLYIYVTNAPCYDNDLIKGDNGETDKRFREYLIEFTKDNKNIKFLLSHHNNPTTQHAYWYWVWHKGTSAQGRTHAESLSPSATRDMQYEVIENGEMHTITKEEKNRIFYSPENSIQHNKIRPKDVLKYIDGDYTFLDENGNSKGKIRDVIGNKNDNAYTFDDLAKDIVNTYENTNKIRFLKRGYFKPFYDAIKDCYNTKEPNNTDYILSKKFQDIDDTIRCTC